MKSELFLGIDQGSSATKGQLLNAAGDAIKDWHLEVPACIVNGREVEQDPEALLRTVIQILRDAKQVAAEREEALRGAGLAFQRSGVLAWDASTGHVIHPMITWADTRTFPVIENIGLGAERITQKTGIPTIANFAGPKIALLQSRFRDKSVYVGTLDSFVLHRLSDKKIFATEDTMAARTMLYDLAAHGWDEHLCRDFKVEQLRLPRIHPSLTPHTVFEDVPILSILGDQQAALLGRLGSARRPLLNLGTIASLAVTTGREIVRKPAVITSVLLSRLPTGGYQREYKFLSELTSPITGSVLLEPTKRGWATDIAALNALCEASFKGNPNGQAIAYCANRQPKLPQFPSGIPNVFVSKPDANDSDLARAVVENVGNLILRMFDEFTEKGLFGDRPHGEEVSESIDVAGGGSQLPFLMQYIADCSGHTLYVSSEKNAGARGAALTAWMTAKNHFGCELLNDKEDLATTTVYRCKNPERKRRYLMWQKLEHDILNNSLPSHAVIER